MLTFVAAVITNISIVNLKSKICTCQAYYALKVVWSVQGVSPQ